MITIVHAPAKINLDLRLLRRRPDGFHEIRTVLQSIALHDTLRVRSRPGPLTVRSRSGEVPADAENIVWRAASALWAWAGRPGDPAGAAVTITKRVPLAAGLGGGSSDAASALRGLAVVWGIRCDRPSLRRLASSLGSDVPFFLDGGTALARGRGERITRIPELGKWWVVLAQPPFGVSTADAYTWADSPSARAQRRGADIRLPGGWRTRLVRLRNDLETPVASRHPDIAQMVARLRDRGASLAAMTGSGSVVFGLFRRRAAAQTARLSVRRARWRTRLSWTTTRAEFSRLVRVQAEGR